MIRRLSSTVLLLSLVTSLPAYAAGGTIEFQGQIVEASCDVTADGTTLRIAANNDACARGYSAFSSDSLPLEASQIEVDGQLVTLTYN
ncbi:MAG: hypothetical protein AAGC84_06760 [Pseudomonas sp.]